MFGALLVNLLLCNLKNSVSELALLYGVRGKLSGSEFL